MPVDDTLIDDALPEQCLTALNESSCKRIDFPDHLGRRVCGETPEFGEILFPPCANGAGLALRVYSSRVMRPVMKGRQCFCDVGQFTFHRNSMFHQGGQPP